MPDNVTDMACYSSTSTKSSSDGTQSTTVSQTLSGEPASSAQAQNTLYRDAALQRMLEEERIDSLYIAGQDPRERQRQMIARADIVLDQWQRACSNR